MTYFICANNMAQEYKCHEGTVFDPTLQFCTWENNYQCGSSPVTTEGTTEGTTDGTTEETTEGTTEETTEGTTEDTTEGTTEATTTPNHCGKKKVVCYYPNWAYYRQGKHLFHSLVIKMNLFFTF